MLRQVFFDAYSRSADYLVRDSIGELRKSARGYFRVSRAADDHSGVTPFHVYPACYARNAVGRTAAVRRQSNARTALGELVLPYRRDVSFIIKPRRRALSTRERRCNASESSPARQPPTVTAPHTPRMFPRKWPQYFLFHKNFLLKISVVIKFYHNGWKSLFGFYFGEITFSLKILTELLQL